MRGEITLSGIGEIIESLSGLSEEFDQSEAMFTFGGTNLMTD